MAILIISVACIFMAMLCCTFAMMHQFRFLAVSSLASTLVTALFFTGIMPLWITVAFLFIPTAHMLAVITKNHYRLKREYRQRHQKEAAKEAEALCHVSMTGHALNQNGVCCLATIRISELDISDN